MNLLKCLKWIFIAENFKCRGVKGRTEISCVAGKISKW